MNEEELAKEIFKWLNNDEDRNIYYRDAENLIIGMEGRIDCKALASVIVKEMPKKIRGLK